MLETHNWSLKQWTTLYKWCVSKFNGTAIFFGSTASAAIKFNLKMKQTLSHTNTRMYTWRDTQKNSTATGKMRSSSTLHIKTEKKFWSLLSCSTVIKRYIPFMEKRGVFKTYKVKIAWRQRAGKKMLHSYKHEPDEKHNKVCSGLLPKNREIFLQPHYANNTKQKREYSWNIFFCYVVMV